MPPVVAVLLLLGAPATADAETTWLASADRAPSDTCKDGISPTYEPVSVAGVELPARSAWSTQLGDNGTPWLRLRHCMTFTLGGTSTRVYGALGARDDTTPDFRGRVVVRADGVVVAEVSAALGSRALVDLDVTGVLQLQIESTCTEPCGGTGYPTHNLRMVVPSSFSDVPSTNPFWADIRWLATRGVTDGYGDGTFRPGDQVSRQAVVAFLYRMQGQPPGNYPHAGFSDVPPDHPFAGAIAWAVSEGVTTGYPDGTFRGGASVQRQAVVAWLARLADVPLPACASAPFVDIPMSHPFCPHIAWAKATGITAGNSDGTFRGGEPISRQAMARFLRKADSLV